MCLNLGQVMSKASECVDGGVPSSAAIAGMLAVASLWVKALVASFPSPCFSFFLSFFLRLFLLFFFRIFVIVFSTLPFFLHFYFCLYSYNKSQRDALFLKFIFAQELYMFRTDLLSIIRSLNTVYAATIICHASYVDCLLAVASRQST